MPSSGNIVLEPGGNDGLWGIGGLTEVSVGIRPAHVRVACCPSLVDAALRCVRRRSHGAEGKASVCMVSKVATKTIRCDGEIATKIFFKQ